MTKDQNPDDLCDNCGLPRKWHGLPDTAAIMYPKHPFESGPNIVLRAGEDISNSKIPVPLPESIRYAMEMHVERTGRGNLAKRGARSALCGSFTSGIACVLSIIAAKDEEMIGELLTWWRSGLEAAGATEGLALLDRFLDDEPRGRE